STGKKATTAPLTFDAQSTYCFHPAGDGCRRQCAEAGHAASVTQAWTTRRRNSLQGFPRKVENPAALPASASTARRRCTRFRGRRRVSLQATSVQGRNTAPGTPG